jgi:hypothetical protein
LPKATPLVKARGRKWRGGVAWRTHVGGSALSLPVFFAGVTETTSFLRGSTPETTREAE